jgi:hypothetical protein
VTPTIRAGLLLFMATSAGASCAIPEERPANLAYITTTILAPRCGTATCHSTFKRQSDLVFDSVAGAQRTIADNGLVVICAEPPCETAPHDSPLLTVMTDGDSEGRRMPLDAPMANKDIALIAAWLTDGAAGYVAP